jgi:hypothetical protein
MNDYKAQSDYDVYFLYPPASTGLILLSSFSYNV